MYPCRGRLARCTFSGPHSPHYARTVTGSGRARILAWALGLSGAVACTCAAGVSVAFHAPTQFLVVYLVGVLMGLLGALVASREPHNSIGWLMCATSLVTSLIHLPAGYAYFALVIQHGAWPLGSAAAWLGAWSWVPSQVFLPLIAVRFPDGKVPARWRFVDWLAITGAALFSLVIALEPRDVLLDFTPVPGRTVAILSSHVGYLPGIPLPARLLNQVQGVGLSLTALGYAASAASLMARFRRAGGDERLQLKWFAYSGVLIAATFAYAGVAWNFFGQPLYLALTPLMFAALTLPVAIGIAILRYRLYDIDLIINRSLVYGSLTAILYAVYVAVTTFLQRLFISVSGQKSDAAYVLTAFVVVGAFNPVKDWLQRQVNRRLGGATSSAALDVFSADVDAVVSVMDVDRVACRLADRAVAAFNATGAALYLESRDVTGPFYSCGRLNGEAVIEVPLQHEGQRFGRLVLGGRRGGVAYAKKDRDALQRSADSVGEALALAEHLGHRPLPSFDSGKDD